MFDDMKSLLVLSPQRTGSNFVTYRLQERYYSDIPVFNSHEVDEVIHSPRFFVGHSHSIYQKDTLDKFNVVFSVRRSITDSILSRIIADQNLQEPFEANTLRVLEYLALQERWYTHYHMFLNRNSNVVIYEVLRDVMSSEVIDTTDKSILVKNYDQCVDLIGKHTSQYFLQAHEAFCDYAAQLNGQYMYRLLT